MPEISLNKGVLIITGVPGTQEPKIVKYPSASADDIILEVADETSKMPEEIIKTLRDKKTIEF